MRDSPFIVSRNGTPVGELRPLRRHRFVSAHAAVEIFRDAHRVDAATLRHSLDDLVDQLRLAQMNKISNHQHG